MISNALCIVLLVSALLLMVWAWLGPRYRDTPTLYEAMQQKERPMWICSITDCDRPGVPIADLSQARPDYQDARRALHLPPDIVLCDYHREAMMELGRLASKNRENEHD